jgi:hypothetical protein
MYHIEKDQVTSGASLSFFRMARPCSEQNRTTFLIGDISSSTETVAVAVEEDEDEQSETTAFVSSVV